VQDMMRVYHAQNANLDFQLGRIMQALDEQGWPGTPSSSSPRHGEMFGAHGRAPS